jgi:hypothetical protein
MGRSRDIAEILGKTETDNPSNLVLLNTSSPTGVDSAQVQNIGLEHFSTLDSLPITNLEAGQQAYVSGTNRLYMSNGSGWFNVALINATPYWDSEPLSTYEIVDSQTPLIITAKAFDSDGPSSAIVNQSFGTDSAQYMVNISNDSSVFTFTPKSADSIGIEVAAGNLTDSNGDFVYTFKWSDGINFVSKISTISYSPNSSGNSDVAFRGFAQGVWGSFGSSPTTLNLTMPSGTIAGDRAVVVLHGLGYPSTQVSFPNGNFSNSYSYEWGYSIGNTGYGSYVWEDTVVGDELLTNGVNLNQSDGSTSYKMATLITFGGGVTPLYNHAQIDYTTPSVNSYYTVASATPPTGYASKTGLLEVHGTREGQRTYTSATNGTLLGSVNRSIYYIQALYQASSLAQQYHRFQANAVSNYSASSITIAW